MAKKRRIWWSFPNTSWGVLVFQRSIHPGKYAVYSGIFLGDREGLPDEALPSYLFRRRGFAYH